MKERILSINPLSGGGSPCGVFTEETLAAFRLPRAIILWMRLTPFLPNSPRSGRGAGGATISCMGAGISWILTVPLC